MAKFKLRNTARNNEILVGRRFNFPEIIDLRLAENKNLQKN